LIQLGSAGGSQILHMAQPFASHISAWVRGSTLGLSVLSALRLRDRDRELTLVDGSQKLLAFLSLQGRTVKRAEVAGTLWPNAPEQQANASLRSALWRLQRVAPDVLEARPTELELSPDVSIDLDRAREVAYRIVEPHGAFRW